MEPIRLVIGLPAYNGNIAAEQAGMWFKFGRSDLVYGERISIIDIVTVDTQPVDRARNFLLATAMKLYADWLLMIDADTTVEPAAALRMIIAADADGIDIVGAPVIRRIGEIKPTVNVYAVATSSDHDPNPRAYPWEASSLQDYPPTFAAGAIGAAVMAVRLRGIGDAVFKFTDEASEDIEFCRQVERGGGKIRVDQRVSTSHRSKESQMIFKGKS